MSAPAASPQLKIRPVTRDDLEEILIHRRRMFEDMGHRDAGVLDAIVRSSRPVLKEFLASGSYVGWFAMAAENRVAAGAGLLISPSLSGPLAPSRAERVYLWNVFTYPEFRKRGLARLLTKAAIDYCRRHGHKILWLHASQYGRPLYESLGFEQTNEMKLLVEKE
jgi:GNAT superfamily N-acetyltransferase